MMELIDLALAYGPSQVVMLILTLKGIASLIANNWPTQKWGKVGELIDVLASNTKQAKLTNDVDADKAVKAALRKLIPKTFAGKALKFFS